MLKTEGIVLKELRYQDTSKILSVFTKKYGKISVMARGAYRPRSQMIANTQPFSYNEFQLYKGRNFYYLNQGDILDSFYSIRDNMDRITYGYYLLELIDKSIPEEQENEKLFKLLVKGLSILSSLREDYLKFTIAYELKFISFLGYRPSLDKCTICGNISSSDIYFSIYEGGLICHKCNYIDNYSIRLNAKMYETIYFLLYNPLENISDIDVSEEILYKIHMILIEYILYNIDRKDLNSLKLIKSLQ